MFIWFTDHYLYKKKRRYLASFFLNIKNNLQKIKCYYAQMYTFVTNI